MFHFKEYIFANNWIRETVATEFDLVCERKSTLYDYKSLTFLGFFLSNIVGGVLSDRFGRKPVLVMSAVAISLTASAIAIFGHHFYVYPTGRFVLMFSSFYNQVGYQYCAELVPPTHRGTVSILVDVAASGVGILLVSLNGYLSRDWIQCHVFLATTVGITIPFFMCIPESYRWYFSKR